MKALDGQVHRDGVAAIEHSKRIAGHFADPMLQAIALLHDVVEDSKVTVQDIREEFGHEIADGVDAMTRGELEPWNAYIKRVLLNPHAILVKIVDIEDNIARCTPTDKMYPKLKMYRSTLIRLRASMPKDSPLSMQLAALPQDPL